jgi:hypothetical protein
MTCANARLLAQVNDLRYRRARRIPLESEIHAFARHLYNARTMHRSLRSSAKVAELVDALALGASGATRESSSLSFRTIFAHQPRCIKGIAVLPPL